MLPFHRRVRRGFYAWLARGFLAAARLTPSRAGRAGGRLLARFAAVLRPADRRLAAANLDRVFGDDPARREAVLRQATPRLGENLFDALTVERRARDDFADVNDGGAAAALRDLRDRDRGVLVLTGHLGCWELLGAWLARVMDGLTVVTGTIHNPAVDRLVNDRRRALGLTPVPRDGDLRPLLRRLRDGGCAAVLMDQNTRVENLDAPFFGAPAPTARGFARLATRTGAPVLPLAIAREGRGHRVEHLPPLRFGADDRDEEVLAACNRALETLILRNPAEWVWFHRRWPDEPAAERKDTA